MKYKVQKLYGEKPIETVVLRQVVAFDAEGFAEVDEEVAKVLRNVPGYEVLEPEGNKAKPKAAPAEKEDLNGPDEAEAATDEVEAKEEEKPKAPKRRPAPARKSTSTNK